MMQIGGWGTVVSTPTIRQSGLTPARQVLINAQADEYGMIAIPDKTVRLRELVELGSVGAGSFWAEPVVR